MHTKRIVIAGSVLLVALSGGLGVWLQQRAGGIDATKQTQMSAQDASDPVTFDKNRYSIEAPDSLWVIVNKQRPLPETYRPANLQQPNVRLNSQKTADEVSLRNDAIEPLQALFTAAQSEGLALMLASGFRSVELQTTYYNSLVRSLGQTEADRVSAKPGTSEHQTGLALDIAPASRHCYIENCFATTAEGIWLAAHAHTYGFILRYPQNKEAVTGYAYEPWHFRYVGTDLAAELYAQAKTMEEFFDL